MRGTEQVQTSMLSLIAPDTRIPADHPLRTIRQVVDRALTALSPEFDRLYADRGRPSIPPEQLLRALLLQLFYSVRSERLLMEQLDYNLLFRWFVGLNLDEPVWVPSVFSKNRDRFLDGDVVAKFFALVVDDARTRGLLSDEHFTVDGTLLEGSAAFKSLARRQRSPEEDPPADGPAPRNPSVNFRGEKRSNATHRSTTDPDVRLARKSDGQEAQLAYLATTLVDNRYGLPVDAEVTFADDGKGEHTAALLMLAARCPADAVGHTATAGGRRCTVGADKKFDDPDFVAAARVLNVTPHVAQNLHARKATSAIDGRTTQSPGYQLSQARRPRIEESFGWGKTVGLLDKLRHRTLPRVQQVFALTMCGYLLVRLKTLLRVGLGHVPRRPLRLRPA
jgi:transposase